MSAEIARAVVYAITAVGAVVWVSGLMFLIRSVPKPSGSTGLWPARGGSTGKIPAPPEEGRLEESPYGVSAAARLEESAYGAPRGLIAGRAEIAGAPAELSAKAAAILAKEQLKILQQTDQRVVFEGIGPNLAAPAVAQHVRRGELRFTAARGNQTGVDYAIAVPEWRGLLVAGALVQALGLVALVAGFFAMLTWVVPNPNPAIRGQSFQMFQVAHFLWPPFLFGGVYRMRRRTVQARFEVLVHNLPYCGG
jgi:hypothetical protein